MATHGGQDLLVFLLGGYDLRANMNNIPAWSHDAVVEDTTPFGVTDQQQTYTGMRKGTFELKGFYDDAALASDAALIAELGATAPLCVGPATNAVGKPVFCCNAVEASYQRQVKVGGVTYVDAKLMPTGEVDEGQIAQPLGAQTANGNSTSIDGTASSNFGLVAYLQVTGLTLGTATNIQVTMQDSADNATWANIASGAFTAVTVAPAAQRLVIPGTIRRYTRVLWSFGGTIGGGTTCTFFVGQYRGTTVNVYAPLPHGLEVDNAASDVDESATTSAAGDGPDARPPSASARVPSRGGRSSKDTAAAEEG